jgi:hypothetical protein
MISTIPEYCNRNVKAILDDCPEHVTLLRHEVKEPNEFWICRMSGFWTEEITEIRWLLKKTLRKKRVVLMNVPGQCQRRAKLRMRAARVSRPTSQAKIVTKLTLRVLGQ